MLEAWQAEGFSTYKLKVGLAGDVTQVATVRQTLGDGDRDPGGRERGLGCR